jgi:threonylcarbamoyladenosine tRNA methylthiotransferase MtaB
MEAKRKVGILTLGCKVNQYESEALGELLDAAGFAASAPGRDCDAFIVNTCTVTAEADRKSRQMIRRLNALNPAAPVVVTGCTAQRSPDAVRRLPGVAAVIGNRRKADCVDFLVSFFSEGAAQASPVAPLEGAAYEPLAIRSFPRTRQYIKIEDGCDNRCAYCAIPSARGPVRSRDPQDVLSEAARLVADGCRELVLTGIEISSYGRDLGGTGLSDLLRQLDAAFPGTRLRLSSVDPSLFREDFVSAVSGLRNLCPHFHVSLQSGSSSVLAKMRRKYNAVQAAEALSRVRRAIPSVMFTADIIVGFPGETAEDFEQTRSFVREAGLLSAHVFPYSRRAGTEAASMPGQVPEDEKKRRAALLSADCAAVRAEVLRAFVSAGLPCEVLFESYENGLARGHSAGYVEFAVRSDRDLRGLAVDVIPESTDGDICYGSPAQGGCPAGRN